MFSILDFPAEYKVNKVLNKERYFKFTNNTEKEKTFLETNMQEISLLYDIKFKDNTEVAVLYSLINYPSNPNKFFKKDYAKFIASSMPYKILLITENLGILRFYAFDGHRSSKNNYRTAINCVYESEVFTRTDRYNKLKNFTDDLRLALNKANTADELYASWRNRLKESCYWNKRSITDYLENMFDEEEKKDSYLDYLINLIDIENDEEYNFFQFCKYYSKILYEESLSILGNYYETDSENWLESYFCACNWYAQLLFAGELSIELEDEISEYFFSDDEMDCPENIDEFSTDEIKNQMINYFVLDDGEDFGF